MKAILPRTLLALSLTAMLMSACGPKPTPGEKDREQANQALDQMPK